MENKNNTVTQEGDEYSFEENADKISKYDSDNEQENKTNRKEKSTWKTRRYFNKINFYRYKK